MFRAKLAALGQAFPLSWSDYFILVPGCLASALIMTRNLNWQNSGIFVPVLAFLTFWLFQARLITRISAFRQQHPELLSDNSWQNIALLLTHFRYPLLLLAFAQLGSAIHWREYGFYYYHGISFFEETFITFLPDRDIFYPHWIQGCIAYSLILIMQFAVASLSIAIALRFSGLKALSIRFIILILVLLAWFAYATTILDPFRTYYFRCWSGSNNTCLERGISQNLLRSGESLALVALSIVDGGALISQEFTHPDPTGLIFLAQQTWTYSLGFGPSNAAWRYLLAWTCSILSTLGLTAFMLKQRPKQKRKNALGQ